MWLDRALEDDWNWVDFSSKLVIQQACAISDIYCGAKWYPLISCYYLLRRLWCLMVCPYLLLVPYKKLFNAFYLAQSV